MRTLRPGLINGIETAPETQQQEHMRTISGAEADAAGSDAYPEAIGRTHRTSMWSAVAR